MKPSSRTLADLRPHPLDEVREEGRHGPGRARALLDAGMARAGRPG